VQQVGVALIGYIATASAFARGASTAALTAPATVPDTRALPIREAWRGMAASWLVLDCVRGVLKERLPHDVVS
jgi:hypothetical protein